MIHFKAVVFSHHKRKDGTIPVKIRITFNRGVRYIPTTLTCVPGDLTRSMKIKNADIIARCNELTDRLRRIAAGFTPFDLDGRDVDWVVARLRGAMKSQDFRLDYFAWAEEFLKTKREGNVRRYRTALNVFARYLGEPHVDVNDITHAMLVGFAQACDSGNKLVWNRRQGAMVPSGKPRTGPISQQYLSRLACIYEAAKDRYNDEDGGVVVIPRSPFRKLDMRQPAPRNAQKPQPLDVLQAMADAPADDPQRFALDVFLVGFGLMGANLADLWEAAPPKGRRWAYFRRKTRERRADHAEVVVRVEPCLDPLLARLGEGTSATSWLPVLRKTWKDASTAGHAVNRDLRRWCDRMQIPPFTFYSCRHSWATLARSAKVGAEKATVDEALGHVGDYRIADIYAERDWERVAEVNRQVLSLIRWE